MNSSKLTACAIALATAFTEIATAAPVDVAPKTAASTDWSDIWWNPNESGWGMQLVQEASTIFATLFIYGADNRPTWAIATLTLNNAGNLTGPVYVTTGPYFGAPWSSANPTIRQAGNMTFAPTSTTTANLSYSIDGVFVNKTVQRQSLAFDDYSGVYSSVANITQSSCNNPLYNGTGTSNVTVNVTHSGPTMGMRWDFGSGFVCNYTGTYAQNGRFGSFAGSFACTDNTSGTISFIEMTNRVGMISGRFNGRDNVTGCNLAGRFSGVNPNVP